MGSVSWLLPKASEVSGDVVDPLEVLGAGPADDAVNFATEGLALSQRLVDRLSDDVGEPALVALLLGKTAQADERGIALTVTEETHLPSTMDHMPLTPQEMVTVLGNLVSWKVDILTPIDSIILGHIHRRAADSVAGNVRVDFAPTPRGIGFTGTATVGSATVVDSILVIMRDGRGYVNIHTKKNPGGEIRGTLVKQ